MPFLFLLISFLPSFGFAFTDIEMAQKFVGRYKVFENQYIKNNCANISLEELYRFNFFNPNYSDRSREALKIGADERGLILTLDRKVKVTSPMGMMEGLDWQSAFDRPSFRGINDGDSIDRLPGLNVEDSSRIYEAKTASAAPGKYSLGYNVGDDIVAIQQAQKATADGVEVRLQMATLSQFIETSARKGDGKVPHITVGKATYVKYQYFAIKYGPSGLLEQIDSVDECVFKRL